MVRVTSQLDCPGTIVTLSSQLFLAFLALSFQFIFQCVTFVQAHEVLFLAVVDGETLTQARDQFLGSLPAIVAVFVQLFALATPGPLGIGIKF